MSETLDAPQTEAAPEVSPADDLRSIITGAWNEHADESQQIEAPSRARDERGRFAANEAEEAAPEAPAEAPKAEPLPAPAHYGADDVARWGSLSREAQEWLSAREKASQEAREAHKPLNEVLEKYKHVYAARGYQPAQAMDLLLQAQHALDTQPKPAFLSLLRAYGLRPEDLIGETQSAAPATPTDPTIAAMQQELAGLRGQLDQRRQAEEAQQAQAIENRIRDFAAKPEHVHFPAVRQLMGALMQGNDKLSMEDAYAMACRADPNVSKLVAAEAEKAAAAERAKAAEDARRKAVSVRGSRPMNGAAAPPDTVRGALERAMREHMH